MRACVVIPTYEEAGNLAALVAAVRAALDCTIGIVDDGSPDGTGEIADALAGPGPLGHPPRAQAGPRLGLRGRLPARAGGGRGVRAGDGRRLFPTTPPTYGGCSRPRARAPTSCSARATSRAAASRGCRCTGGCCRAAAARTPAPCSVARSATSPAASKCFRADALRAIDLDAIAATGFAFQVEATYRAVRAGLRVQEVPIVFHERRAGHSKLSAGIAAEALWRIPALR